MSNARKILDSFYNEGVMCPACGGDGVPLGGLGRHMHFRCQSCGMDFSEEQTPESREQEHEEGWGNFSDPRSALRQPRYDLTDYADE